MGDLRCASVLASGMAKTLKWWVVEEPRRGDGEHEWVRGYHNLDVYESSSKNNANFFNQNSQYNLGQMPRPSFLIMTDQSRTGA